MLHHYLSVTKIPFFKPPLSLTLTATLYSAVFYELISKRKRWKGMPVEILTREEVERVVEERLKKLMAERPQTLLEDVELKKKVVALEASIVELKDKIAMISASLAGSKPMVADPLVETLKAELGERVGLLEIRVEGDLVILRPKRYLGSPHFRATLDIVRKHGGNWAPERRVFTVRRR